MKMVGQIKVKAAKLPMTEIAPQLKKVKDEMDKSSKNRSTLEANQTRKYKFRFRGGGMVWGA